MPDWSYFDRPMTAVENNLNAMAGRADDAIDQVSAIVAALENLDFSPNPSPPNMVLPDIAEFHPVAPDPPDPDMLGDIVPPGAVSYADLFTSLGVTLADFSPTLPTFTLPPAPDFPDRPDPIDTSGKPDRPTTDTDIQIPVAPEIIIPDMGALADIDIPDFVFPSLPLFDGSEPVFDGTPPPALNWTEPTYASENLDELTARISALMAGGTGLPAYVQQSLFDAARQRENLVALEAEQEAFDTFAGKNFSMPPGMLVKAVTAAHEKSRFAQNTLERDILGKAAQWEIENIRVAIEKGLGLETLLVNKFNNFAQRTFDAAKFRVEADIQMYNALVTLFNARQTGFRVLAEVFKIKTDAELAHLEVYKAQIQGAIAKGQLNEQLVKVYVARIEGVKQFIELYKAKMEGARTQAEVVKAILEGYNSDVKAWAEKITAEKTRFEAYFEEVRAVTEESKSVEYQARAFEATVKAQEAGINGKAQYVNAKVNAAQASVAKYKADLEQAMNYSRGTLEALQARAAAFSADTNRYAEEIKGINAGRDVTLRTLELRLSNQIKYFDILMKEFDSNLGRAIEQVKIKEAALDSAARTTATVASGALSAIHVQASAHGNAAISDSNQYSSIHNFQGV